MTLSEELTWRGFYNQTTLDNITDLDTTKRNFYWGVDPSADSMHIGQLALAMMVKHFINHGYKAVLLVGGATGVIGDPDGKSQERDLKALDEITKNKAGIAAQYNKLFDGQEFELVDNYDWFKNVGFLDFLRDVGKNFSMTQLLDRDFVQKRIGEGGSGISYAEFSYSLIQGYDFLHLFREKGVTLQIAGADQWGNSISGVHLIKRLESAETDVYTAPLVINKSTGTKFGKSEAGAIWLDEAKTSVFDFYQFFLNTSDDNVIDYLKLFTMLTQEEVEELEQKQQEDSAGRQAQKTLAYEVTATAHGKDRAGSVRLATEALFADTSSVDLSEEQKDSLVKELPSVAAGDSVIKALAESEFASSLGEARRMIEAGSISIDGNKILEDCPLESGQLVKKGKNNFLIVK
jgi:tyrosyl-tRNA synthetase